jgi:hypothetical protein
VRCRSDAIRSICHFPYHDFRPLLQSLSLLSLTNRNRSRSLAIAVGESSIAERDTEISEANESAQPLAFIMHSSPVLPTHTSVPIRTNDSLRTLVPSVTLTGDSQYSKYPGDVGNINILGCNPTSDRCFSHPTDSRLSEQVLHASTDEFPIFLALSDSQFRMPDFLLFSDAPMIRPTSF